MLLLLIIFSIKLGENAYSQLLTVIECTKRGTKVFYFPILDGVYFYIMFLENKL